MSPRTVFPSTRLPAAVVRVSLHRTLALLATLLLVSVVVPPAPATHGAIVPYMELLAQHKVPGIRPGAWMEQPAACTFAFVVEDSHGTTYITSAGHCVNRVGQAVTMRELGEIGRVVAYRNAGPTADYALIRIHDDMLDLVDPTMIGWGGPTGLYTSDAPPVDTLKHYGWGSGTWADHQTRCRTGVAATEFWTDRTFTMYSSVLWGDSGSGTMTSEGLALGINTHLNVPLANGFSIGPRFDHALAELGRIAGLELSLVEGRPVNDTCDPEGTVPLAVHTVSASPS